MTTVHVTEIQANLSQEGMFASGWEAENHRYELLQHNRMPMRSEEIPANWRDFCHRNGWLGMRNRDPSELVEAFMQQFASARTVLVADPDPVRFVAAVLAGIAGDRAVFLGNPQWKGQEWEQVFALVNPEVLVGSSPPPPAVKRQAIIAPGVMIPTGGSSGRVRFAMHTWTTLSASVAGAYKHFGNVPLHSACVLPLHHVSGLMQFLRAFLTGGQFACGAFVDLKRAAAARKLSDGLWGAFPRSHFFLSLVPTQLQQLLDLRAATWLSGFSVVLLGGAPPWPTLLEAAREARIPLGLTYGSTETASQIATLKPAEFLAGNTSSGRLLPHARLKIQTEGSATIGRLAIAATSLCQGYFPEPFASEDDWFWTDDLGWHDAEGYLHISGRCSRKIVTGGENVMPEEVEAAVLATGLVADVCITSVPDPYWGEAVVALYVRGNQDLNPQAMSDRLPLARYKHPKHWLQVETIPRSDRGKVDLAACARLAAAQLRQSRS